MSKLQFLIKKISNFFSDVLIFFKSFGHQNPGPGSGLVFSLMDPDPQSINTDPKYCYQDRSDVLKKTAP
jgi:hypothetical protein